MTDINESASATDVFRTMIIPAPLVGLARALGAGLSPGGTGMFTTGLYAVGGKGPPTHYISSGMIGARFAQCIASADALYEACVNAGATVTVAQCTALVANSVVTDGTRTVVVNGVPTVIDENPHQLLARLNLEMVSVNL